MRPGVLRLALAGCVGTAMVKLSSRRDLTHWTFARRTNRVVLPIKTKMNRPAKKNAYKTLGSVIRAARGKIGLTHAFVLNNVLGHRHDKVLVGRNRVNLGNFAVHNFETGGRIHPRIGGDDENS